MAMVLGDYSNLILASGAYNLKISPVTPHFFKHYNSWHLKRKPHKFLKNPVKLIFYKREKRQFVSGAKFLS